MKKTTFVMMILVVLSMISCESKEDKIAKLIAHEWQLKEMKVGDENVTLPTRMPTLTFTDTNMIYGFSGCNRFFGKFSIENNNINLTSGGTTMMACPNMDFEDRFMKVFQNMTQFTVSNNELKLKDKESKETLTFVPRDADSYKDEKGCDQSKDEVWSEMLQTCIVPAERGIMVRPENQNQGEKDAYILFSRDSSRVELFIPGVSPQNVLDRRSLPNGGYAWNVEDDDTYNVREEYGRWIIERRGNTLYSEENSRPHTVRFEGGDGKSRRLYNMDVFYDTNANTAKVTFEDKTYELQGQPMASGFLYSNDNVSLSGKGDEIEFTTADGKKYTMKAVR